MLTQCLQPVTQRIRRSECHLLQFSIFIILFIKPFVILVCVELTKMVLVPSLVLWSAFLCYHGNEFCVDLSKPKEELCFSGGGPKEHQFSVAPAGRSKPSSAGSLKKLVLGCS